ncbi:MAG: hypothetical protein DWB89_05925 [Candidatus Poseidoniales archaeon]|nr:MAG: hypothetical protein DWB89_05925 [Candidatus Poseidoniales archaeon]
MGRIRKSAGFMMRWLPWVATGTAAVYRSLPDKSQNEIKEVAKEPSKWGDSIEKAWDTSKIGAEHFKQTSTTLSSILIGRRVSRKDRIRARDDLAALSLVVPPLRVFMIPGSQVLLGIMARVTPWRLVPDDWVPISALKKVREEESTSLDDESSLVRRLLRR